MNNSLNFFVTLVEGYIAKQGLAATNSESLIKAFVKKCIKEKELLVTDSLIEEITCELVKKAKQASNINVDTCSSCDCGCNDDDDDDDEYEAIVTDVNDMLYDAMSTYEDILDMINTFFRDGSDSKATLEECLEVISTNNIETKFLEYNIDHIKEAISIFSELEKIFNATLNKKDNVK